MSFVTLPFRGLLRVFKEIAMRAEEELDDERPTMAELTDLYRKLEAGTVSEAEFEQREALLVERLGAIEKRKEGRNARRAR
jgi:hypothetical protein